MAIEKFTKNEKLTSDKMNEMVDAVNDNTSSISDIAVTGGASTANAVIFSDGQNAETKVSQIEQKVGELDDKLEVKETCTDGSVIITDGNGNEKKYLPQSLLAKWGVVKHTQNWTTGANNVYTYTLSNIEWGWIPMADIKNYTQKGATFNEESGYFEMNGLTDLSYENMLAIDSWLPLNNAIVSGGKCYVGAKIRTNFYGVFITSWEAQASSFCYGTEMEILNIGNLLTLSAPCVYFMSQCYKLRKVINVIKCATSSQKFGTESFGSMYSLETIYINGLRDSVLFKQSSLLNAESVAYMINNVGVTTEITITLHATAYARAMADADVQAALAAHTNVTLVSA